MARADGRYARLLNQMTRGPEPLIAEQQRDPLEIVEDRYSAGSLIITSQVLIDRWYEIVGNGRTLFHGAGDIPAGQTLVALRGWR